MLTSISSSNSIKEIVILITTLLATCYAVCPDSNLIKPCTCDDEGLQCLKLNNSLLERVFRVPSERKAIRKVWIFQTNLTALTENAFGDYIIRDIYLDLNQIHLVQVGAFGEAAKTLQSLSLTRNLLTDFPFNELRRMKKLKHIALGNNQLVRIITRAFPPSNTLESIDISHNRITCIEENAFAELYEVTLIDLSRNLLTSIERNSFLVKSSSRHLAISVRANLIDKVAVGAFGDYHPETIDLSLNRLSYLDELTFRPLLMNNTVINVDDNPFSCYGCDLYKWLLELDREYLNNLDNFICADDTKLEDLTLEIIGC